MLSARAIVVPLALQVNTMDGMIDRSRFIDRIVMDPHRVMETSSSSSHGPIGVHADGNLDFLKQAVDLGVSRHPCTFSFFAELATHISVVNCAARQTSIMAVAYDGAWNH